MLHFQCSWQLGWIWPAVRSPAHWMRRFTTPREFWSAWTFKNTNEEMKNKRMESLLLSCFVNARVCMLCPYRRYMLHHSTQFSKSWKSTEIQQLNASWTRVEGRLNTSWTRIETQLRFNSWTWVERGLKLNWDSTVERELNASWTRAHLHVRFSTRVQPAFNSHTCI